MVPHGEAHRHLDSFCHFYYKGKFYNGYPAQEVLTPKGCVKLGVEHFQQGVVTRGILIDLPRLKNVPYVEPRTAVFFFFQAEDGIRDGTVTGVQTCALPI